MLINSIENVYGRCSLTSEQDEGYLELSYLKGHAPRSHHLLLDSLVLGLESYSEELWKEIY